jgi:hypothetical protein
MKQRKRRIKASKPIPLDDLPLDDSATPIEEVLAALASQVPKESWDNVPDDLADNLDHYLYGAPKR